MEWTLVFDKEGKNILWEKSRHFQQMVLIYLDVGMQKNANRSMSITLLKTHNHVVQRHQYQVKLFEPLSTESWE